MSDDRKKVDDIEVGQSWDIYRFVPEDAEGVVRLFRSVYGAGYPVRTYVEPDLLIRENAALRTISSVAKTPAGDIVGHNALFNSAPHSGTYETGAGLVHAAYRGGKGIFTRMVAHGLALAATLSHVDTVFGESVCNHPFSQKMTAKLELISRALEVDLMPAAAYEKEASSTGRVAAFLDFKTCRPKPHRVYLPGPYADTLRIFYDALDDERDFCVSKTAIPAETDTVMRHEIFDFAGVVRIAVDTAGSDFSAQMDFLEKKLREKGVRVWQVWLNLANPWVSEVTRLLQGRGYFMGGVLPRWFDTDGFLMQKIQKRPDWEGICVAAERGAKILETVRADWKRSTKEENHGS